MVDSKLVLLAFVAVSLFLSGAESREIMWRGFCCINQQQFAACDTKQDNDRCEKLCLHGCSRHNKGALIYLID
ncbi:hypothetical protein BRARA_B00654 [Brassica rapa]|uniref:Embryo surrounding factor 1 brassicaceae domain-containing protein n=1 Tax=Brassica campestris TaxID=3711 RepID=A0A398A6P6_BRACM|nr:hypothetical protein BRARA_B00654 [Brassica rapa]